MNDLTVFDYNGSAVRTVQKGTEVWWVLTDVCKVLELTTPSKVAARLDADEKGVNEIHTLGGQQNITIINEPGLYSLILRSNKPEAKAFKRWVTHEVLPSIRSNGFYASQEYDKIEIAEMLTKCKTVAAVKAITNLFEIPVNNYAAYIPTSVNSVSMFLLECTETDMLSVPQSEVYKWYREFCKRKELVPSILKNFSQELHKQTGLTVKRRRIDGKLVGFYVRGDFDR